MDIIEDDPREFTPHRVRQLVEHLVEMFHQHEIETSADELREAGYKFWVEDRHYWILNKHGNEISLHRLVTEVFAEHLKQQFISEYEKEEQTSD